jgi:hypothetical protein
MFIEDVKATSESQTNKLPSYHGFHTYLKQSKVIVSKLIVKNIQSSTHKYGATICLNGWDNVARHPLLNVMFVCPNGDVFLSAINIMGECKDTHYICNVLVKCIKLVGVDKFVQICINNASNMWNATNLLICHFS